MKPCEAFLIAFDSNFLSFFKSFTSLPAFLLLGRIKNETEREIKTNEILETNKKRILVGGEVTRLTVKR
jgi:hypothetical protein